MSQWAEIRHQHLVEGVSKKQIARRLQLYIKKVRRAVEQPTPPVRASSPRVRSLDPWRAGRLPHLRFRDLLGVRSRYGPHGR